MKYVLGAVICLCLHGAILANDQDESVSNKLIDAINSGKTELMQAFVSKEVNYQDNDDLGQRWVAMLKSVRREYGELSHIKTVAANDELLEIYCATSKRNAYFQCIRIRLWRRSGDDKRFIKARGEWSFHPDHLVSPGTLEPQQIKKHIDRYAQSMAKNDSFSGTVLLANEDNVIYEKAFGWADSDQQVRINLETKLNLASATKMFTSVAISQLVEEGKLTYQTRLEDVLPEFRNRGAKSKITIHQLLTHTSGLGDFWNQFNRSDRTRILRCRDYYELVKNDRLLFKPGTDARYSNVGCIVLGLVIEQISGIEYKEYIRRNVFKKAGMENSDFYSLHNLPDNLAHGLYFKRRSAKARISNHDHKPIHGSAAGGAYSTVRDMLKFRQALFQYKLVGKQYVDEMITPKVELFPNFDYGYLFQCPTIDGHQYIGHDGGSPGISAEFRYFPKQKMTLIVISNFDQGADELAEYSIHLIMR